MKKIIFLYAITILLVITAVVGTVSKKSGENVSTKDIVLLTSDYEALVDTITIKNGDTLILSYTESGYIGASRDLTFPVNNAKISELFSLITSPKKAQIVKNTSSTSSLSTFLDGIELNFFSFFNNEIYSSLVFGETDFSGTMRYVKSTKNDDIYLVSDDYYSFLETDPRAWLDSKLIPSFILKDDIASISLTNSEITTEYLVADTVFDEVLENLFSLQSSNIVSPLAIKKSPLHTIAIEFSNGGLELIDIFVNDETYIVVPQTKQLFYGLEISQWTYEKLVKSFQI